MNVPKVWLEIFSLLLIFDQICCNIDSKEYFCGKKLVKTLTELCSIYNHPTFTGRNRFRRQIVDECCRSQCTRRYLVHYYCLEANSSIRNLLKTKPEPSSESVQTKPLQEVPKESLVGTIELPSNTSNHDRITHGRRNCKCRKRRAKRIKKARRLQAQRNFIQNQVPPANIGHVERSQTPFYIWKFSRVY